MRYWFSTFYSDTQFWRNRDVYYVCEVYEKSLDVQGYGSEFCQASYCLLFSLESVQPFLTQAA